MLLLFLLLLVLFVILAGDLLSGSLCYHSAMPKREYHFWVYILSSRSRNLYVGMTNKIVGRTEQHRESRPGTFTARYHIHRLVYFEYFKYFRDAIARGKELKRFTRAQKIEPIEKVNPAWEDLYPRLAAFGKADPLRG